jgi:NAD(P)-dependent dehydrogenase (short-subunit alcohol dehydrogenase family)
MDFTGRVALVTGAGSRRGIGRETARQLAARGATVIVSDIHYEGAMDTAREIQEQNGKAEALHLDVSNRAEVKKAVQHVLERYGKLDILVNNAGISLPTRVLDIREEEWDRMFNINVKSVFYLTQEVLPHMKERGYGRIVNVSSVAGKRGGGLFGGSHYAASKAAISGFSKAVAREMAPFGITCNTVLPGVIDTDLTGDLLTEEIERRRTEGIAMGRVGKAEDVAFTIAFLASEKANYITGEEVDVNGGLHID